MPGLRNALKPAPRQVKETLNKFARNESRYCKDLS